MYLHANKQSKDNKQNESEIRTYLGKHNSMDMMQTRADETSSRNKVREESSGPKTDISSTVHEVWYFLKMHTCVDQDIK